MRKRRYRIENREDLILQRSEETPWGNGEGRPQIGAHPQVILSRK